MADPIKPLDRNKPFKRINNDSFKPASKPDGDGVSCGCHTPKDFGEFDKEFEDFIKENIPVLGPLLKALDLIDTLLDPGKLAAQLLSFLPKPIADILGLPAKALGLLLAPARKIVTAVKLAVDGAVKVFTAVLARRILPRAIRVIPQWVPVKKGASNKRVTADQIVEIEGLCTRSFGNPVDVPFFNWHTWFNWNIQVKPEPEYANVVGDVPDPPGKPSLTGSEQVVNKPGSFEIQVDPGALFDDSERSAFIAGFKDAQMPQHDGHMISPSFPVESLWPMAGMFVWASGRHVYDCSRVSDPDNLNPQMCTMMNPARALATARWTAAGFIDNNNVAVPAIEFMFVTSKRGESPAGGNYIQYEAIDDTDYEFIVDLPPLDLDLTPFPIAHTDDVPHSTIVLRPRLLKDLRFLTRIGTAKGDPIVETLQPADPKKAPSQVKITIPKSVLSGAQAYGFVLSLGWADPDRSQAAKVKVCNIDVTTIQMRLTDRDSPGKKLRSIFTEEEEDLKKRILQELDDVKVTIPVVNIDIHPFRDIPAIRELARDVAIQALKLFIDLLVGLLPTEAEEEWLLRMGVNGVWIARFFTPRLGEKPRLFSEEPVRFKTFLADGDPLFFAMHGTEFDPVGDIMHSKSDGRTLKLPFPFKSSATRVAWEKIVNPDSKNDRKSLVFEYALLAMFDTTEGVTKMALGFDNSPLGLIDPDSATAGTSKDSNPLLVKATLAPTDVQRLAHFARAEGHQMILVEDPGKPDYRVNYTLEVKDLLPKNTT